MKRNLWLRVYDIIQPYRGKLILSMFSLLCLTGLGLLPPIWGSKLVGLALPQGDRNLFLECVLVLVVLRVVTSLVSFAYSYQMRILGGRLVFDLRRRIFTTTFSDCRWLLRVAELGRDHFANDERC